MSQFEKLLQKFLQNPQSLNVYEIMKILEKYNFEKRDAKWSHTKYTKWEKYVIFPIHNGDCKNIYKKEAQRLIKEITQNKVE